MSLRLSNSEMVVYRRCLRKWYLSVYRRLAPRALQPGTPLSLGTLVHDGLAAHYDPASEVKPVAYIKATCEAAIKDNPAWEDDLIKERDLAVIMIEGYLEWLEDTGADADLRVLGAESMVEVPLTDDVLLISKLDAPVERKSDGAKLALEHKTTQSLDRTLRGDGQNTQYLTEHLARFLHEIQKGATPDEAYDQCQGILLNMLRKVKRTASARPPFYGREDVIHNIHELRAHWVHVMSIARAIQMTTARLDAGETHQTACPPNPTKDCSWDCEFFKVCRMFDDGSNVENALQALYRERDPLERYDDAAPLE